MNNISPSLLVLYDLCSEGCLCHYLVANEHVALHRTNAVAYWSEQFYTEEEGVSWHYLLTELHFVELHEVSAPTLWLLQLVEHEQATTLCHCLNLQYTWHHWLLWEVTCEEWFVASHVFTPTILVGPIAITLSTNCIG